jgi:hypothetical protein
MKLLLVILTAALVFLGLYHTLTIPKSRCRPYWFENSFGECSPR